MKKIILGFLALISVAAGEKIAAKLSIGAVVSFGSMYGQLPPGAMSAGPSTLDSSYTFFQFNNPTNIAGNRWEPLKIGLRETHIRTKRIYFDTLSQLPLSTIASSAQLLTLTGREVRCSPLSGLTLSISTISGLQTSLNSKLGQSDTIGKWMPQGATYDRSTTNEIQTLSKTDSNLNLSLGGGTVSLAPSTGTVTRAINGSTFQISSTLGAYVFYTIRINCIATIGASASATVNLQYSLDNGSNWVDVGQIENTPAVSLAAILSLSDTKAFQLNGFIPAGAIVRMNQSLSGTTTITYVRGQETF